MQEIPDTKSSPMFVGSGSSAAGRKTLKTPTRANRFLRQESDLSVVRDVLNGPFGYGHDSAVKDLLRAEVLKTNDNAISMHDSGLWLAAAEKVGLSNGQKSPTPEILRGIYARAKIQRVCFSVFAWLHDQNLVSLVGLEQPMQMPNCNEVEIGDVTRALLCFFFLDEHHKELETEGHGCFLPAGGYCSATYWLATVIVRGSLTTDLWYLMKRMKSYGELGKIDMESLREYWPSYRQIKVDPVAGVKYATPWTPGRAFLFAFYLPHNLGEGINIRIQDLYRMFDEENYMPLETLFFKYFNLPVNGNLPLESLPLEFIKTHILKDKEF